MLFEAAAASGSLLLSSDRVQTGYKTRFPFSFILAVSLDFITELRLNWLAAQSQFSTRRYR